MMYSSPLPVNPDCNLNVTYKRFTVSVSLWWTVGQDHVLWHHRGFIPPELWLISVPAATQSAIVPIKEAVRQTTCSQSGGVMAQVCVCAHVLLCVVVPIGVLFRVCVNIWSNSSWQQKTDCWNDGRRQKKAGQRRRSPSSLCDDV